MRPVLNPVLHELATALKFIGLRDRLRCPSCRAIGTWKPHGALLDSADERNVRRWLCKWCGHYVGPEGTMKCIVDYNRVIWTSDLDVVGDTPEHVIKAWMETVWPWRG